MLPLELKILAERDLLKCNGDKANGLRFTKLNIVPIDGFVIFQCWTTLEIDNIIHDYMSMCRHCGDNPPSLHRFRLRIKDMAGEFGCAYCGDCFPMLQQQYVATKDSLLHKYWILMQLLEIRDIINQIMPILLEL